MEDQVPIRAALSDYYDAVVDALRIVDNIGVTDDAGDLYVLVDSVARAAQHGHPPFLCATGCSSCCKGDVGLPLVTVMEWVHMHAALLKLPEAHRKTIIRNTHEQFASFLPTLLPGKAGYLDGVQMRVVPKALEATVHCPMLLHERCSVYDNRPLGCRAFGYFMKHTGSHRFTPYMCSVAIDHIEETFPDDTALPVYNAFEAKLTELAGPKPVVAFLPLWVAAHVEGGHFRPNVDLSPDFPAAVARFLASAPGQRGGRT